ncbi:hypothetical protein LCGC14_0886890 [marine sediment metagenome]|uniref:PD-(D/E)XK endonuclease-like domain-containing protein n=1 Tax=marine sediment metagenome TaxID=412755 RepID=A0A0F9P0B3_9ZZZZ
MEAYYASLDQDLPYMQNSMMYLENTISKQSDGEYDTIYPYMMYLDGVFLPTFQFTGIGAKYPIPEFFHDYPVIVDQDSYEKLMDEYSTIYKVIDSDSSQNIELIPKDTRHRIYGEIAHIDVYFKNSLGEEYQLGPYTENEGHYSYNKTTGILSLSDDTYFALQFALNLHKNSNQGIEDYDAYYILEIKVEKYRSANNLNGMSQEAIDNIATMQAIEQNILEYTYQFKHAQNTQKGLSEMFYTVFITTISTVITVGITLGISHFVKPPSVAVDLNLAGLKYSDSLIAGANSATYIFMEVLGGAVSQSTKLALITSPISESIQEIFVDPYLEIIVSDIVANLGGSVALQVLISSLVEGGREAISGPLSQFLFGKTQTNPQGLVDTQHLYQEINPTDQNSAEYNIETREYSLKYSPKLSSFIKTGASLILGAALMSMGGPMFFGASIASGLIAIQSISKDFKIQKTIIHNIVSQKLPSDYYLNDVITDEINAIIAEDMKDVIKLGKINSISKSKKPSITEKLFNKVQKLKKSHAYATFGLFGAGLLGPEMLIIGAAITGISIMVKKVVNMRKNNRINLEHSQEMIMTVWEDLVKNLKSFLFQNRLISQDTYRAVMTEFYNKNLAYFYQLKATLKAGAIRPSVIATMYYKILDSIDGPVLTSPSFLALTEEFKALCRATEVNIPRPFSKHTPNVRTELFEDIIKIFEDEFGARVPIKVLSFILFGGKGRINSIAHQLSTQSEKFDLASIYNLYAQIKELNPSSFYKFRNPNIMSTIALFDIPSVEVMDKILERVSDRLFQFAVETHYDSEMLDSSFSPYDFRIEFDLYCRLYHIAYNLEGGNNKYISNNIMRKYFGKQFMLRAGGVLGIDSMYNGRQSYNYLLEKVRGLESSLSKGLYSEIYSFVKNTYPSIRTIRKKPLRDIQAPFLMNLKHIRQNLRQIKNNALKLLDHFQLMSDYDGEIPTSVKQSGTVRISSFNNQLKGFTLKLEKLVKATSIKEFMDTIAEVYLYGDSGLDPMISSLLSLTQNDKHSNILAHGGASHRDVQMLNLRDNSYSLAVELPVYFEYKGQMITGHVDLLLIKDGVLYVADYKPDQTPEIGLNYLSFLNSVPQLAAYAIVLRDILGIDEVRCITFNKDGAWVFDPDESLAFIEEFLAVQSKVGQATWTNYLGFRDPLIPLYLGSL